MESTEFPIVIKKRNGAMIGVVITEVLVGIIFGITGGGLKNILLWLFLFIAVITAFSLLSEYSKDILLKENKIEFYKNNDLINSIKYSSINSIYVDQGNEPKTNKKDFFTIGISGNAKKGSKTDSYLIDPMGYSAGDLAKIKDIIVMKNSSVEVNNDVDKFIKR